MPLKGHRILLVEDEIVIALDIESALHAAHGEVVGCAANVAKAMTLADAPNLSLAILDFRLGSETSLPLAAKLYELGIPFIFHTGGSEAANAWPLVPVGKPAAPGSLVGTLVSLVSKRRARDESKAA